MATACELTTQIEQRLLARNEIIETFFAREAFRLAAACREMSERFLRGGRLLAFGRGPYATDAQHVSVEFVHPVIVGKRALPALDLSMEFHSWLDSLVSAEDIVMGFGPPEGDPEVWAELESARRRGAMTFALPGVEGSYARGGRDAGSVHASGDRSKFSITRCGRRYTSFSSIANWGTTWARRNFSIRFWGRKSRRPARWWRRWPSRFG